MGWLTRLAPGLAPYAFLLKLLGALAAILALMSAGAFLMHDRDEAAYQTERRRAAEAAQAAQDQAIAAAVSALQLDHQREMQAAEDMSRQQLEASNLKLAAAQDAANHAQDYACKLGQAGFEVEQEAFK